MPLTTTRYEHITTDEKNVPLISGTTTKVIELIAEKLAYGWSPEELHFQHPYLTLGQIYSALAYYSDHEDELNRDLDQRLQQINKLTQASKTSSLRDKLRAKGLL